MTLRAGAVLALASFVLSFSSAQARPLESNRFTKEEIGFLQRTCPDVVQVVPSGTVVAYGEIATPPIVLTTTEFGVFLNDVEVFPRRSPAQEQESKYLRRQGRIAELAYQDARLPEGARLLRAAREAARMSQAGLIGNLRTSETEIDFTVGDAPAGTTPGRCPHPLQIKTEAMLWALSAEFDHQLASRTMDCAAAQGWLKERLDDLKSKKILSLFSWPPDADGLDLQFACDSHASRSYAIGKCVSLIGELDGPAEASRESIKAESERISGLLGSGDLLVVSVLGERTAPRDEATTALLEKAQRGKTTPAQEQALAETLHLSPAQLLAFLDELR